MKNKENNVRPARQVKQLLATTGFLIMLLSNPIMAQKNWILTVRGAADFPTKQMGDATLKTAFGGEATIAYQLLPKIAIYTGWAWNKFNTENLFNYTNVDIEETGYRFGLQYESPFNKLKLRHFVGVGALYNHLEIENSDEKTIEDSGHGWGWKADVGFVIPLGSCLDLTPTVRYQSLKRNLNNVNVATSVNLNYISVGLGVSFLF